MSINDKQYLHEMGICTWELVHPDRLEGYQAPKIDLPSACKLLLISPVRPEKTTAVLFENILKSMNLTPDQALHIEPDRLPMLDQNALEWIWFAGCEAVVLSDIKQLTSPLLQEIDGNNHEKRALWQQICSYTQTK